MDGKVTFGLWATVEECCVNKFCWHQQDAVHSTYEVTRLIKDVIRIVIQVAMVATLVGGNPLHRSQQMFYEAQILDVIFHNYEYV